MKILTRTAAAVLAAVTAAAVWAVPAAAAASVQGISSTSCIADNANILSRDTETYITNISVALQENCSGAQIGVYTTDYVGNNTMEGYAYEVFQAWGLGSADQDNGMVLLMATGDDNYWATPGEGLESAFSGNVLSDLLYDNLEASWAKQDYDTGARKTVLAMAERICDVYGVSLDMDAIGSGLADSSGRIVENTQSRSNGGAVLTLVLLTIIIAVIVIAIAIVINLVAGQLPEKVRNIDISSNNLYDISISYEGAREAVSYRVLYGTKRAINIAEIVPKESKKAVPLEETKMQELFRAIHVGDQEKIRKEAIKETEKLHKNAATISQYNLATMEIVSGFFKFCANNSMDFNEISGNVQNLYERVTQLDESSMTNWIINMSMAISEKLRSTRNSTSRRIITDAQNIVKDRYMEPALSLDDVCADLGVSNSYFSSIFKKETGQSFVSYLTDYRMDRAEEMVLNTDEKSYKIAEKVGYQDANYFSYVFKKKFGVSPSKYRASGK